MRLLALAIGLALAGAAQAGEPSARMQRGMQMLGPAERLEQICSFAAMTRIRKERKEYRPDRAVAGARAEPRAVKEHTIEAAGAAFRSRGKWYALAYTCTADAEHLKVLSFSYTIGEEIPETKWAGYSLW